MITSVISPLQGRQSKPRYCYFVTKFPNSNKINWYGSVGQLVIYSTKLGELNSQSLNIVASEYGCFQ